MLVHWFALNGSWGFGWLDNLERRYRWLDSRGWFRFGAHKWNRITILWTQIRRETLHVLRVLGFGAQDKQE